MSFNINDYIPQPNNWFKTEIKYEGRGRAEFLKPKGWIEGRTIVEFDETGNSNISMQIEDFYCEEPLGTKSKDDDLIWLLNGRMPRRDGNSTSHSVSLGEPNNNCTLLRVETSEGIFEALDKNPLYVFGFVKSPIKFDVVRSQFRSHYFQLTKYWILPLTNFVSDVSMTMLHRHPLNWHPLRLYLVPPIPSHFEEEHERVMAVGTANSQNHLITFMFNKMFGFIELLPDYDERKEKLLQSPTAQTITALMIGKLGTRKITSEDMQEWLPLDYLHLLSLATGSLVGTPWIEFRDKNGNLAQRLHIQQWQFPFFKGIAAFRSDCKGGIGQLLTKTQLLDTSAIVAIRQMVKAGQSEFYLEDRLAYLFRAFDTLTKDYRTPQVILGGKKLKEIEEIIKQTEASLDEVTKTASSEETKEIKAIIPRMINTIRRQPKDGEAALLLLEACGFQDTKVIPDRKKWVDRYQKYRNQVIHESYIKNHTDSKTMEEVIQLLYHLYDMLLRIILRKVGYNGDYRCLIVRKEEYEGDLKRLTPHRDNVPLDWIQETTTPQELGYE